MGEAFAADPRPCDTKFAPPGSPADDATRVSLDPRGLPKPGSKPGCRSRTYNADIAEPWSEKIGDFKKLYEAAVQRSSAHSEKMKQLQDIEEQLGKHIRETARVREQLRNLAAAEAGYRSEREAWETLLKERDDLLEAQCKTLTESSGGSIRAHVKRYAVASDFVNNLRQCLSGSRLQAGKIEKLGDSITAAEEAGSAQWNAVLLDLERLAEFDAEREGVDHKPETPALVGAFFVRRLGSRRP